jgi:hypothetical protein
VFDSVAPVFSSETVLGYFWEYRAVLRVHTPNVTYSTIPVLGCVRMTVETFNDRDVPTTAFGDFPYQSIKNGEAVVSDA